MIEHPASSAEMAFGNRRAQPTYLRLHRDATLKARSQAARALLTPCRLCPRACGADRLADRVGHCNSGRSARVASAAAHFGEEAPLVGTGGSGTIFFSACNLLCSFCQNYDISHYNAGTEVTPDQLAEMMVVLQQRGCHNINFVTPTHVVPQILEALPLAIERGLQVPLVYNCGGYESVETLRILEDVFDIYMPDFKFWDNHWADVFCNAPDYRESAKAALKEMHRQVGDLVISQTACAERGLADRGLLVRHLVMPNAVAGTREIVGFLATEVSTQTYLNIMDQYRPCYSATSDPKISRRISRSEYEQALRWAGEAGLGRLDRRF